MIEYTYRDLGDPEERQEPWTPDLPCGTPILIEQKIEYDEPRGTVLLTIVVLSSLSGIIGFVVGLLLGE